MTLPPASQPGPPTRPEITPPSLPTPMPDRGQFNSSSTSSGNAPSAGTGSASRKIADRDAERRSEAEATRQRFGGFEPIGALTADNAIGHASIDLEVSPDDRPADVMPEAPLVSMVGTSDFRVWRPTSPTLSTSVHQPLYFQDLNLERYGTPCRLACRPCCQPFYSGAKFAFQAAALPYQMTLRRPHRRYRYSHAFDAGRFGFREKDCLPWDRHAAAVQTAATLGLVFLIP